MAKAASGAWAKIGLSVTTVVLLTFFFSPPLYRMVVRSLPTDFYYIGTLDQPPDFDSLVDWPRDLSYVELAPRGQALNRLIAASDQIAHLDQDYVPGRGNIGGSSEETAGRNWQKGKCLFIRDVVFDALSEQLDEKGGRLRSTSLFDQSPLPADRRRFLRIRASELRRIGGRDPAGFYRSKLADLGLAAKPDRSCPGHDDPPGPRCTRIAVWAEGRPASCSIWPFPF